jgi:hypothetical protein
LPWIGSIVCLSDAKYNIWHQQHQSTPLTTGHQAVCASKIIQLIGNILHEKGSKTKYFACNVFQSHHHHHVVQSDTKQQE